MSLLKKANSLYRKICYAYVKGEVAYPRVGHNYIELSNLKFYEYPHPPLEEFDEYSISLQEDSYLLDKRTVPLWLTHKNIATPATLIENYRFIDKFITDGFEFRNIVEKNDLIYKLELLIEQMAIDNQLPYYKDIEDGFLEKNKDIDIFDIDFDNLEQEDEDKILKLLNSISSDGEIQHNVNMQITPYSIIIEPSLYSQAVNKSKNEDEDDNIEYIQEREIKEYPSSPKININPLMNYNFDTVKKTIKVQNVEHLLMVDNQVKTYKQSKEILEANDKKLDNVCVSQSQGVNI